MRPTRCSVTSLAALVELHNWVSQDGLCCLRQTESTFLNVPILFSLLLQTGTLRFAQAHFLPMFLTCFRGKWKPVKEVSLSSELPIVAFSSDQLLCLESAALRPTARSPRNRGLHSGSVGPLSSVLSGIHVTSTFSSLFTDTGLPLTTDGTCKASHEKVVAGFAF